MQTKGPIGMKLTNRFFYSFLPIILFGNFVLADDLLGPNTKSLVENAFDQELKKFKECISVEGLIGKDQINTECPLQDLTRLYETLNQIQDPDLTLFLEGFTAPEKLKTPTLYYPKKAQQRGITGFAIVSFDLDWTKIYLGVALVNTDRMLDGIYYLNSVKLSAKKNKNDGMIKIVDSILLNIENALN